MSSVLSSFFSRDPKASFPYELPTSSVHCLEGVSIANTPKKGEPTENFTCFWTSDTESGTGSALKIQAQKLKTLRHPNVLAYVDSIETNGNVYLITEACMPLKIYMSGKTFRGTQKEFVISWGLFQLLNCLKFLHSEAKLSHENIRNSIFVTEGGDWKLGGLEKAISYNNSCHDLNSLAMVIWELFNGFHDSITKLAAPGKIPQPLHNFYRKIATSHAAKMDIQELINDCRRTGGFCKNRFVDTLLFLDEFQLKDTHEKQTFFSRLNDELDLFPDDVAKYRILPKLIFSYEYGDAGSNVLTPLFRLGKLLDYDQYQRLIVPCLCKLFNSPDRVTRVKLLDKIDEFASHLSSPVINEKIYGNIASGFMDTNPAVRESTVKAMASVADKLNYHNLNVELMKHLARLQGSDEQPSIRTNATICLGKIAFLIDPQQRQKILISAFTRALKDPFPPSRMAAILALSATQQYYSLIEVANRVLPALAPITCDPEKQVRDQCFKALHGFVEKLEKASENPDSIPELEAQVQAGGRVGILSSDKVPQWASWALKSLSGKFYKGSLAIENRENKLSDETSANDTKAQNVERKLSVEKSSKSIDDGWSDLEDRNAVVGEEEWEDAKETISDTKSGWDDHWEESASKTIAISQSSGKQEKKSQTALKLKPMKRPQPDDDLDQLLGISSESKSTEKSVVKGYRDSFGKVSLSSDPVGDNWINNSKNTAQESATTGWDDVSWGDSGASSASSAVHNRDMRRAETAARNEARRKELEKKRLAKKLGGVRLTSENVKK